MQGAGLGLAAQGLHEGTEWELASDLLASVAWVA